MSRIGFHVTYSTVTPESAEIGDVAESGFAHPNGGQDENSIVSDDDLKSGGYNWTLAQVLRRFGKGGAYDTGESFDLAATDQNYQTGAETTFILHLPRNVTDASHARIARAIGARI